LELGLEPHFMSAEVLQEMMDVVLRHKDAIDEGRVFPRVAWSKR